MTHYQPIMVNKYSTPVRLIFSKEGCYGWETDVNLVKLKMIIAIMQNAKRNNGEQIFKTESYFINAFETTDIELNY